MKKIATFLLALLLLVNLMPTQMVFAEEENTVVASATEFTTAAEDIKGAVEIINSAIGELPKMTPDKRSAIIQIISGLSSLADTASTIAGIFDTCTTFMKLLGLMRDPVKDTLADIKKELDDIKEELDEMYSELIGISDEMKTLEAITEFKLRAQEATTLLTNWNDFTTNYMENTMDSLMNKFDGEVRTGWDKWMRGDRIYYGVDNSSVTLIYDFSNDEYTLRFSGSSGVPADLGDDGRYVVLPAEVFPETMEYNINTYRTDLENYISAKILETVSSEGYTGFDCANFPAFTAEGAQSMTEEIARQVAKDTIDVISYRLGYAFVNNNASFPLDVKERFTNYCDRLFKAKTGTEAILNAYYLTHAFEFEVKDDMTDLLNELIAKTGVYGLFAMNILGMSRSITNSEKESSAGDFCTAITKLDKLKSTCLTGVDQYCYLTNSEVYVTDMSFETTAKMYTSSDAQVDAYISYSANKPTVTFLDARTTPSNLIGEVNMKLIDYTLQSNGDKFDRQYIEDHFRQNEYHERSLAVTEYDLDLNYPIDKAYYVRTRKPNFGSFFTDNSVITLNSRPGSATSDHYVYHRMSKGSVLNMADGNLASEKVLSGLAVYGESHWYWVDDEAAFLGGPADYGSFSSYMYTTCTDDVGKKYYTHTYGQLAEYNAICMRSVPLASIEGGALDTFKALSDTLSLESLIESHEWDEGVVIKEPTCSEPGTIKYTALDDSSITYTEEIEALPHEWDNGKVTLKPGYDEKGIRTFTCLNDPQHTYTECIEATGVEYTVTDGANGTWTKGSGAAYTITVKRNEDDTNCFSHYTGTMIDSKAVAVVAKPGSTIITISAETLEKLSAGTHTITVEFDDGQVETELKINTASPLTGDNSLMGVWLSIFCLSGAILMVLMISRKKRNKGN